MRSVFAPLLLILSVSALADAGRYQIRYDTNGRLKSATNQAGDVMELKRDANGVVESISFQNQIDDDDGDGLTDFEELASSTNPFNSDTDGDTLSDPFELTVSGTNPLATDSDLDLTDDANDQFPTDPLHTSDNDLDGIPDGVDPDDDNDGVIDNQDEFPIDASEQFDTDKDGLGNNVDSDDDGDGVPDLVDADPLNPNLSVYGHLGNISTRADVRVNDEVTIVGFVIEGEDSKSIVIRGRGSSLLPFGIEDFLQNPTLQVVDSGGNTIATNDDWQTRVNANDIPEHLRPTNPEEAAVMLTLQPGAYTAILRGVNSTSGIGIVEVFQTSTTETKLINLSTRGHVGINDRRMIGGIIISGDTPIKVTFRVVGPSLNSLGVPTPLENPFLQIFDRDGILIAENDDWQDHPTAQELRPDLVPQSPTESAITLTLSPGAYTAVVSGIDGTEGIALIEAFDVQ